MKKHKLRNGLRIIEINKKSDIVTIQVSVNVGSNNETQKILGISHFIEHMVFEGTKNRTSEEIANSIEGLGGEISAYTSNETTCFYIKILKKYFNVALNILSDILINPLFNKKLIEKERKIILSEIHLVIDQPRYYQWILFNKTLFNKYPTKNPIYGTTKAVKSISREDIIKYFKQYYTAPNMVVSVVGNIPNLKIKLESYFKKLSPLKVNDSFDQEIINYRSKKVETRKIGQSYAVLGYKTPKRKEYDSYVLDVIRSILGRGLSGKLFREIRVKHSLAYDVGIIHDPNMHYGTFAAYFSTNKKNILKCVNITLNEFNKLKKISEKELTDAKLFIEGEFIIEDEDSQSLASKTGEWELISKAEDSNNYIKTIKKVTRKDIERVVYKYLNKNYSLAVIEQS